MCVCVGGGGGKDGAVKSLSVQNSDVCHVSKCSLIRTHVLRITFV